MIKDKRDPDPKRRYKMIYNAHNGRTWVFGSLATLQGKTVRFRIRLTKSEGADPRLYAVYIRSQQP